MSKQTRNSDLSEKKEFIFFPSNMKPRDPIWKYRWISAKPTGKATALSAGSKTI